MAENPNQPREFDAVFGGENSPPVDAPILGGIEGLRRRFTASNTEQRINVLSDALKYGDKGVDLLVEAMNDEALIVRANAYMLLLGISSTKAQQAIANGVVLNPGNRLYSVYESGGYYHEWHYITNDISNFHKGFDDYYAAKFVSRHLFRESAEAEAESLHKSKTIEVYSTKMLARNSVDNHELKEWCAVNKITLCEPYESTYSLENRILKILKDSKNVELMGQLWDLFGIPRLAFVHEEIVNKKAYFGPK